jgi:hypothetical protein
MTRLAASLVGVLALGAVDLGAQTTVDEGTFRLTTGGRATATETFSIRQRGEGAEAVIIARGRIVYREGPQKELTTTLQVSGEALRPSAYDLKVEGAEAQQILARMAGTRFSARVVNSSGERAREYLVSEGALVAEEGVAHHHYFVVSRGRAGVPVRVPIIVPLQGQQVWANVTSGPEETIQVAGQSVSARRLTVSIENNGDRQVWVDAQGRVLRLEIPARSIVAERTALPQ